MTNRNRNTVLAIVVLFGGFTAARAVADNVYAKQCQAVEGSAWSVASVSALVTPETFPLTKIAEDSTSYVTNIAQKLCPPEITAPAPVKKDPDPPVSGKPGAECYATFHQAKTGGEYNNFFGVTPNRVEWNKVLNWGDLGKPSVYDFNTDADVRAVDPAKAGEADDAYDPGDIVLPVGYDAIEWRADTKLAVGDLVPLFLIPTVVNGYKEGTEELLEESPKLAEFFSSEATDVVTGGAVDENVKKLLPKFLNQAGTPIAVEAATRGLNVFKSYPTSMFFPPAYDLLKARIAANADVQDVWVYDNDPPTLQTDTDPSSFPANLQPLVSYDPNTGTYYVEATGPGIPDSSVAAMAQSLLSANDKCQGDRPALVPFRVTRSGAPSTPAVWHPGDTGTFEWQVQDSGPNHDGQPNLSKVVDQKFGVRDTHPPALIPPPSRVVEISPAQTSVTVPLGSPRAFDLGDPTPAISNNLNADSINVTQPGITTITWTATDASGNAVQEQQLINVKLAGTNTAPIGHDQSVSAVSYKPVDIVLTGYDADVDPKTGRHDPLSFTIKDKPAHGFFIAPLLPYFIDDYRLGSNALRFANQPEQQDPNGYCTTIKNGSWQMQYPYDASWITVDDDGTTVVYDQGNMICADQGIDSANAGRLAMFDVNGNFLRQVTTGDIFVNAVYMDWRTKGIYIAYNTDPGTGNIVYYDKNFTSLGSFSTTGRSNPSENVANPKAITADGQGIVYFANANQIAAYQGPTSATALTSNNAYNFLGMVATTNDVNVTGTIKSMATDSQNNLYISMDNRVLKYQASTISTDPATGQVKFVPGAFVGWMGRCDSNLTNTTYACDTVKHRSLGFSCSDSLCGVSNGVSNGADPGQFDDARGVAIDPHDILYVADRNNSRIERFTPEGDFAGQAKSTGVGYGFILGDFGNPVNITVNSDHLYILNNYLLHSLQTTPVTPIDDSSARVTYQSVDNFVGTDRFSFIVSDGLATGTGNVSVEVTRNYRPPEISVPPRYSFDEGGSANITLVGSDPDGSLDTLTYSVVTKPQHGSLTGTGANLVYTPDPYYYGTDSFAYVANDGVYNSAPATVVLTINPIEHAPQVRPPATDGEGLGFDFQFPVDVFDPDANESLQVTVDWGDGSSVDSSGVVLDQNGHPVTAATIQADGTLPAGMTRTGPVVNLGGDGNGTVDFQHAYTATGDHVATICATDRMQTNPDGTQQPTAKSRQTCTQTTFSVSLVADLLMYATSTPDHAKGGTAAQFPIIVSNRPFDVTVPNYPKGLDAADVVVNGENGSELTLSRITASQGSCSSHNRAYRCRLGNLAYGASATITVLDAIDPLAPGNARLSVIANRQADMVPLLGNDVSGVVTIDASGNSPVATALSNSTGVPAGGETLLISGHDFDALARVQFGNVPATNVQVVNSSEITLTTPAHAAGTVDVVVTNSDGQTSSLPQAFRYAAPMPRAGGGGCTLSRGAQNGRFDPTFYVLLLIASVYLMRRHHADMA